jgi:predicted component of type VI protein secretion system
MVTLYQAAGRNYREVEKGLAQVERSVAAAIRRNDKSTVDALLASSS